MAYIPTESRLGLSNFTQIDTSQQYNLGIIVKGEDTADGGGEFIYGPGVANLTVGQMVTYNPRTGVVVLTPNTANLAQPVAVAMSANTAATSFGWFQIAGVATIKKIAVKVSPNVALFQSSTTGRVTSVAASGKQLVNARSVNSATIASTTSTVKVLLDRSFLQGAVA